MNDKCEKNEVKLFCPHCGEVQSVFAHMVSLEHCKINVVADKNGRCELDWENADTSGDFEYCCEVCDTKLADRLDEVEEKIKAENGTEYLEKQDYNLKTNPGHIILK